MSNDTEYTAYKERLNHTKEIRAKSMPNVWDRRFADNLETRIEEVDESFMFEAMDMKTLDMVIGYAISVLGNVEFRRILEWFMFEEVIMAHEDEMDWINDRSSFYPYSWKEERVAKADKEKAEADDFIKRMSERFFDGSSRPLPASIRKRFWDDLDHRTSMRTDYAYAESHEFNSAYPPYLNN